jgi:hypothetical protein
MWPGPCSLKQVSCLKMEIDLTHTHFQFGRLKGLFVFASTASDFRVTGKLKMGWKSGAMLSHPVETG